MLDFLLKRKFKASKFKALANLAISRVAVLKNHRQARCSLARSDVVQILSLGHHDRALLRVEQVIKEQNMLDVFVMIEGYCLLLSERVKVIENEKGCPDELKEAISSLIFAASRCGEFPELKEIRAMFTSRYGREFTARAVELRNHCGVNPKIIQKLSTRLPSVECRMKALKEIADENGIALQIEDIPPTQAEENQAAQSQSTSLDSVRHGDDLKNFPEEVHEIEGFNGSVKLRKQYKDVADAAQEAFVSAAYAAAAARAAVELSRSKPRSPDDSDVSNDQRLTVFSIKDGVISGDESRKGGSSGEIEDQDLGIDKFSIDSDDEETEEETEIPKSRQNFSKMDPGVSEKEKQFAHEVPLHESDEEANGAKVPYFSQIQNPSSFEDGSRTDDKEQFFGALPVKRAHWMNSGKRPVSVRTRK